MWYVYQLRSETELLYVGYTRRLKRRLSEHRRSKPWWPEATRTLLEEFASEDDARQREKAIWVHECPKYNRYSPFVADEELAAKTRARVDAWTLANQDRKRAYVRAYHADPVNRPAINARNREWLKRNRPTTVAGRRAGRWQQSGPTLFD